MSSQDRLENVLRDIHIMISRSEVYDAERIIVSKNLMFDLIDRLNASVYEIMDEYELTQQSRDRALRENRREGEKIIQNASHQAEDIYAASVLYTEEALNHLHYMVEEADATIGRLYKRFQKDMKQQEDTIRENHLELKSQLQLLTDTNKYLRLIEERNREIERERNEKKERKTKGFDEKSERHIIKPEIKINEEYFRKAGIPLEKDEEEQKPEEDAVVAMEPLEDEGVIESTLRKAEHMPSNTAADQSNIKNIRNAESEEEIRRAEEIKVIEESLKEESMENEEKVRLAEKKILEENTGRENIGNLEGRRFGERRKIKEEKRFSEDEAIREDISEHENQKQDVYEETEGNRGLSEGGETEKNTSGIKNSEETDRTEMLQNELNQESSVLDDEIVKVNLDAEYFKWKQDEQDEHPKQQQHEKLSLLDKLMGKKKSF